MKTMKNLTCWLSGAWLALTILGCGSGSEWELPSTKWEVGGCASNSGPLSQDDGVIENCSPETLLPEEKDYCIERLFWQYDREGQILQLVDFPVHLNCCGIRSVRIGFLREHYAITEVDEPDENGNRCKCMCDSIFSACIAGVPEEPAQIRLYRHITDEQQEPVLFWEGTLDLLEGRGQIELGPSHRWACQ